jgi:hypothetical protein
MPKDIYQPRRLRGVWTIPAGALPHLLHFVRGRVT